MYLVSSTRRRGSTYPGTVQTHRMPYLATSPWASRLPRLLPRPCTLHAHSCGPPKLPVPDYRYCGTRLQAVGLLRTLPSASAWCARAASSARCSSPTWVWIAQRLRLRAFWVPRSRDTGDWGFFRYKNRLFSIQDIIIYPYISRCYHCVSLCIIVDITIYHVPRRHMISMISMIHNARHDIP
jgi:hypothetical protein